MKLDAFLQRSGQTDWIIQDLLPANQKALVAGYAGGGKSWLLEAMALAVASGKEFLGHYPVLKTGPVLLVDQDSPGEVLAERLRALTITLTGTPPDLHVESQPGYALDHPSGLLGLAKVMRQVKPLLVILETVDTLTSASFQENKATSVRRLFKGLHTLQAAHPCAILLSHHLGKKGQRGEPITYIRGSSSLPARVDVGYAIRNLRGSRSARGFLITPFPKRVKMVSAFQAELVTLEDNGRLTSATLQWTRDWDPSLDADLVEKRGLVLDLARDRGWEGITVNEVKAAAAGYLSEHDVRDILDSLYEEKLVTRGREAHNRFRFWVPECTPLSTGGQPGQKSGGDAEYEPL